MSDRPVIPPPPPVPEIPMEPFKLVAVSEIPRPGPTMVQIAEKLVKLDQVFDLVSQVYKRQQQVALMVDGFGSNLTRRLNDVQTECALIRAMSPHGGKEEGDGDEAPESKTDKPDKQKARAVKLTGKVLMYGATLAAVLRMVGNLFPEHKATIDGFLEGVGL
jgi:hypothetical protein